MSTREGTSEHLLLEALAAAWSQVEPPSARATYTPGPAILLIGVQSASTVAAANALAGAARVRLLHLDRAAGGVGCGLGNVEAMLGDSEDVAAGPLAAGSFAIVGLNVEAAKSYRLLREIVAQAASLVRADGCLLVAGPKKGGAEAAAVALRALFETVQLETYRKGHRVYRASGPRAASATDSAPETVSASGTGAAADVGTADGPTALGTSGRSEQLVSLELRGQTLQLVQDDRIFARGKLDLASRMLAEIFEVPRGADILDLGCGGGVLGILAARLDPTAHCTLVDADPLAVAAARRGAALSGAENVTVHLSDVLSELPGQTFDVVLMNPPFHRGRVQDRGLAERFLTQASAALRPGGRLWVVCNRFLPYERTLTQLLGVPHEVAGDRAYKVLVAVREQAARER